MAKSSHAATAAAIKQELKSIGVKASVKSSSFSMGNSVTVTVVDQSPKILKQINELVKKYQYGSFNGMEDIYEYTNSRDDIPQAKYVSVTHEMTDDYRKELLAKINKYYNKSITWEELQSNPWGIDFESAFGARDVHSEIYQLSTGAIDYEKHEQGFKREQEVKDVLVAAGVEWYSREVSIYFYNELQEWLVSCSYTNERKVFEDDGSKSANDIAIMLLTEYVRMMKNYVAAVEAQKIVDERNNRIMTPVEVDTTESETVVYFPALNKNCSLDDNDSEIMSDGYRSNCIIKKTITLSAEDYQILAESLLQDREYLFDKIGGSVIEDEHLEGLTENSKEYWAAWNQHGKTLVVKIVNADNGFSFFVNTEGFGYARYVGRSDSWFAAQSASKIIAMFQ